MLRKSQAAMEFLMTYGWAILVVLAAVAALAYFGVLSPERFLPEKCTIAPGIACISSKIESTQSTVVLSNGLGRTITITKLAIGSCSGPFNYDLLSGTEKTFTITGCTNGVTQDKFKADINVSYTEKDTGLTKTKFGALTTKIE